VLRLTDRNLIDFNIQILRNYRCRVIGEARRKNVRLLEYLIARRDTLQERVTAPILDPTIEDQFLCATRMTILVITTELIKTCQDLEAELEIL
jgi:hypothetical protein